MAVLATTQCSTDTRLLVVEGQARATVVYLLRAVQEAARVTMAARLRQAARVRGDRETLAAVHPVQEAPEVLVQVAAAPLV